MWKIFSKDKAPQEYTENIIKELEALVKMAVALTSRGDNLTVFTIINKLEDIFLKIWQLKKSERESDRKKFASFLWQKDFFEKYIQPIEFNRELIKDYKDTKRVKDIEEEASLMLSVAPERKLRGFTIFLSSFEKLWKCAFKIENKEVCQEVSYLIDRLLAELSYEPANNIFVEQLLILRNSITYEAITISKGEKNLIHYGIDLRFYIDIVFNSYRRKNKEFDWYSYLNLFDSYFFIAIKNTILKNEKLLFEDFVSLAISNIFPPVLFRADIDSYLNLIKNYDEFKGVNKRPGLDTMKQDLDDSLNKVENIEDLKKWLEKFDGLKNRLKPYISEDNKKEDFAVSQFKCRNFLLLMYAIGAYCLFKENYEYIKYMWEFKQPPDADATWIGFDIIPHTINGAIRLFLKLDEIEFKYDFREEHHGSRIYFIKYFLLLLVNILSRTSSEDCNLSKISIHKLSDLDFRIQSFKDNAKSLIKEKNNLIKLGFDANKIKYLFEKRLKAFLDNLKEKIKKEFAERGETQKISQNKVKEFKQEAIKSFKEHSILREIFIEYLDLYDNKSNEICESIDRIGLDYVDHKAAFFDDWHITYADWGTAYGNRLAYGEDSLIFSKIISEIRNKGNEEKHKDFKKFLVEHSNKSAFILFTTHEVLFTFFEHLKDYIPSWYGDCPPLKKNNKEVALRPFKGWFKYNNKRIPIFDIHHDMLNKEILVINKKKFGKLIQYSPLSKEEFDKKNELQEDIFYMYIKAFSENEELMNKFLEKPPEWLVKKGDRDKQEEHLKTKVLIQIYERFDFKIDPNFEGYLVKIID